MQKKYKIWVDEAGRWPRIWPVVAGAFAFNSEHMPDKKLIDLLADSKSLTEKKREEIYSQIIEEASKEKPTIFFWAWVVDNFIIDEINIRQANKEAMRRALEEVLRKIPKENVSSVVIDWRDNYEFEELDKKPIYIIKWDTKVAEISGASIIAKVLRDKLMLVYDELYPNLWLKNHKWYGTKKHKEFLNDFSKVTWIHRKSYKPVAEILDKREKLLLHVCCAPDATIPLLDYKDKYDITCFWYDPNIHPEAEYKKRLKALKKVCKIEKIKIIEWDYNPEKFFEVTKGLESEPEKWRRCHKCYDFRLEETAKLAKELWIEKFTTTLSISPHKDVKKLFCIWEKIAKKYGNNFLKIDFRKNAWFERSVEYTKENKIYRQDYCGCVFSETYPNWINNKNTKK